MIQWYPGHMAKAKRQIEESLRVVDIVFELIDSRIPYSSRNPLINQIVARKPRLILMTKSSMTDDAEAKKWQSELAKESNVLLIDAITGHNINKITIMSKQILAEKFLKEKAKGLKPRPIRCMIVGIPNVGKSTLINCLVKKKVTTVANKPGVTKAQQWVRINNNIELLDTPGVLWPKFDDPIVGYNLALTGAIRSDILPHDELANHLLNFLRQYYPQYLIQRYSENIDTNQAIIESIMKKRGLKANDYDRTLEIILNEFKNNQIGRVCLDRYDERHL